MKTIQSVARYFPDRCGGIQTHLSELMPVLKTLGVDCQVAASEDKSQENFYTHQDIDIYRYPTFPRPKEEPNHGEIPHGGFDQFARWLTQQKADIYHQHQWNTRCGLPHLRLAKSLGMATVVSIRLPQPICLRRTLMLEGETVCDGKIDIVRCSRCCEDLTRPLPSGLIKLLSHLPLSILSRLSLPESTYSPQTIPGTKGVFLRPLVIPAFVAARQQALEAMIQEADCIFTMCEWLYQMLQLNGVPEEKLAYCPHGIIDFVEGNEAASRREFWPNRQGDRLRIGFLGRWDPVKGIHILVEAIKLLPPDIPIQLIIYGVPQDTAYRKQMLDRIGKDPRIQVNEPVSRSQLPETLSTFDVLAVPSQWLETGPVVVLEAHQLGIPVIGSDLGGIAEKITHNVNGLLVPVADIQGYADTFSQLVNDPNLLPRLRQGITPVRTIQEEAMDTLAIYERVLNGAKLS